MIHEDNKLSSEISTDAIPIVVLLIGGGVGSISLVQSKLIQCIPVLVFKGTGAAPDLIAQAYEDFGDRLDNLSDNHLRTAIAIRINEKFPKESKDDSIRNRIKDNILQIIKFPSNQVIDYFSIFISS
jgi:methyl coenzyme M reductase alpha subunit